MVQGATVTATTGTWTSSPSGYSYQWQRCTTAASGCIDIAGANSSSYTLTSDDTGYTMRVEVTADGAITRAASSHTGPVWVSDKAAAADAFRPYLLFDGFEPWRPLNANAFFTEDYSGDTPSRHQECVWDSSTSTTTCGDLTHASDLLPVISFDPANPVYIKVHGTDSGGSDYMAPADVLSASGCDPTGPAGSLPDCNSGTHSSIYYDTGADATGYEYFNYWFFYRFNKASLDNHEGDWENVTIVADARHSTGPEIAYAYYSEHNTGTWYTASDLALDDGHPDVYVAAGSHASYADACTAAADVFCPNPALPEVSEYDRSGTAPWGHDTTDSCLASCLRSLESSTDAPWADWAGLWGIPTVVDGSYANGPKSPEQQSAWQCATSGWTASGCPARASGMRSLSVPTTANAAPSRPQDCPNWFGGDVVALVCDQALLRNSISRHKMEHRWSLKVSVVGGRQHVGSSPGVAQVLGGALLPGEMLMIRGSASKSTTLKAFVYDGGYVSTVQFNELGLEHGGSATLSIRSGTKGARISLITPRGVMHPSTIKTIHVVSTHA
jgi:hypothetical protein